jgi:hypothetical protein
VRRFSTGPWVAALLLGGQMACGLMPQDTDIDITYDPCASLWVDAAADATAAERLSIDDAIEMWNQTGSTRLLRDGNDGEPRLVVLFEKAPLAYYGLYRDEVGDIVINRHLWDRWVRALTIAHELGHAFGLTHVDKGTRTSVMNPGNDPGRPTDQDAEALGRLWGRCAAAASLGVAQQSRDERSLTVTGRTD